MKKNVTVGLLMTSFLIFAGCSSNNSNKTNSKKQDNNKQTLAVVESAELPTMDISKAVDVVSFSAISQTMEGLYEFDDDSIPQPALAKEVVDPTNDGLTYTISLKEDGKWSNGDPVTAHDFVYSWQRTVDPATSSEYAYLFSGIVNADAITKSEKKPEELGVKALDDYTLEISLEKPIPYLNSLLAKPTFYPQNKKAVEEFGDSYATSSDHLVYNGAFKLDKWDGTNTTWNYVKNDKYRKKKNVKLDEINVTVVKENGTSLNMYQADEVDIIPVKGEFAQQQKDNADFVVREYPSSYYIQYNFENKLVSNKNLRKAIGYSLNSKEIADTILGDGSKEINGFVATGILNPKTGKDFAEESGKLTEYDKKKAQEYWKATKLELGDTPLSFTLLASDTDSAKKLAEYVQGQLESTLDGLKVNVSAIPFSNRLDKMSSGDFEVVLAGWSATFADPVDFLQLANVDASMNFGKWKNEEYGKIMNDVTTTYAADPDKRWESMLDAHKLMMEELPYQPLYQSSEAFLVKPKVKGLVYRALGSPYYKNVSIEN